MFCIYTRAPSERLVNNLGFNRFIARITINMGFMGLSEPVDPTDRLEFVPLVDDGFEEVDDPG